MFCPNCGTNNPDGSKFCSECGTVFNAEPEAATENKQTVDQIIDGIAPSQSAEGEKPSVDQIIEEIKPDAAVPTPAPVPEQPAQPVVAPVQSAPAPEQPVAAPAPQQVQPAQPMPQYQQPAAPAAPKPPKPPRKPLDAKQKKMLIIGGSCGAVLVAFLIVLFAAIIPHSGLKGKLRYTWTRLDTSYFSPSSVLDFKKKRWTIGNKTVRIKDWKAKGDRVAITTTDEYGLTSDTEIFVVAFSPDGKKVYLFDADGYDDGDTPDYVFSRDKKDVAAANLGGSLSNDFPW